MARNGRGETIYRRIIDDPTLRFEGAWPEDSEEPPERDAADIPKPGVVSFVVPELPGAAKLVIMASRPSDAPAGPPKKTLFDARFCSNGRKEYLTVDTDAVIALAVAVYPKDEALIVLVNEGAYGGSGDAHVAVCTRNPSTRKLVAHELGHAAFDLADEFEEPGTHGPFEPLPANVTIETRSAHLKWKALLSPGVPIPTTLNPACGQTKTTTLPPSTAGAFEGGRSRQCSVFRPSVNCRMRSWNSEFCKVCKAEIRTRLTPFLP